MRARSPIIPPLRTHEGFRGFMPILKREPDVFPEGLFDLSIEEFPWWVAHVRSRQEKALARHLHPLNVPFYLPLGQRRLRRAGRSFVSHMPLFSGYVFFRGTREQRYLAVLSHLIVNVLEVEDQVLLGSELARLRALQESGLPLFPHVYVGSGDVVRIREGPFRDYSGIVLREKGRLRLVVSVSMLRRSVSVELDRESLSLVRSAGNAVERAKAVAA
jgi:transcription antitermination factor NusG